MQGLDLSFVQNKCAVLLVVDHSSVRFRIRVRTDRNMFARLRMQDITMLMAELSGNSDSPTFDNVLGCGIIWSDHIPFHYFPMPTQVI